MDGLQDENAGKKILQRSGVQKLDQANQRVCVELRGNL